MASPNTQLRNWLDNIDFLRREFDSYEERLAEWAQPGSAERARAGVKQRLAFQVGTFLRIVQRDGVPDPSTSWGVIGYSHFLRVTLLVATNASMDEAVASVHQLNDDMTATAKRWLRDGVDEAELARVIAEMKIDAERIRDLGGNPEIPS
jgi:hypothetical protein